MVCLKTIFIGIAPWRSRLWRHGDPGGPSGPSVDTAGKPPPPPPITTGGKIAYVQAPSQTGLDEYTITTANPDGTGSTLLTAGLTPEWSPQGGRIAFTREHGLSVINADGTGLTTITTPVPFGSGTSNDTHPSWTAVGTKLVWVRHPFDDPCGGVVMEADVTSGEVRQLWPPTDPSDPNYDPQPWLNNRWMWAFCSPDGKHIAVDLVTETAHHGTQFLDVTNPTTPVLSKVVPNMRQVAWNRANPLEVAYRHDPTPSGIHVGTLNFFTDPPTVSGERLLVSGTRPTWSHRRTTRASSTSPTHRLVLTAAMVHWTSGGFRLRAALRST